MALLTDVTKPVVINTTLSAKIATPDWLRRVCFVSLGHTNLQANTIKEVTKSDYMNILLGGAGELSNQLEGFFAYSGVSKGANILELGAQPGEPLEDSYTNQIKWAKEQSWFDEYSYWLYVYENYYVNGLREDTNKLKCKAWYQWTKAKVKTNTGKISLKIDVASKTNNLTFDGHNGLQASEVTKTDGATDGSTLHVEGCPNEFKVKIDFTPGANEREVSFNINFADPTNNQTKLVQKVTIQVVRELAEGQVYETPMFGYAPETAITYYETKETLIQWWNRYYRFSVVAYETFWQNNRLEDNKDTLKLFFNNQVVSWFQKYLNDLGAQDAFFKQECNQESLERFLGMQQYYSRTAYEQYLSLNGTFNPDYYKKFEALKKYINEGKNRQYLYVLPYQLSTATSIKEYLFSSYNGLNDAVYFVMTFKPDLYSNAEQIVPNVKSVFVVYDNGGYIYPRLAGAICGIFASSRFDISSENPASSLNYKTLTGFKFNEVATSDKTKIINASDNFVDMVADVPTILNGRMRDTYPLDYWYQWDLTAFYLDRDIKNLLLNGVNNPKYAIRYNQNGIDTLKARVMATLDNCIALGLITDYSQALNQATGEIEGTGLITAINFAEYVRVNPENYQNEIYGGISFYLRIGRYIRQVVLNVTLG